MGRNFSLALAVGGIIAGATLLIIGSLWNSSLMVDEVPHLGAGYSYVTKGDMRLNSEHPPLTKDFAGLALLPLKIHDNSAFQSVYWQNTVNGQWDFGRLLIYNSGNDAQKITRVARAPMALLFAGAAVMLFVWTKALYGPTAGLAALAIFCFSPAVLAHGGLVTTDMAATFGVLLAGYGCVHYLAAPNRRKFWFAALALGVALLTKFSALLLIPALGIIASAHAFASNTFTTHLGTGSFKNHVLLPRITLALKNVGRIFVLSATGFLMVVWPVYILHTLHYPPVKQAADTRSLLQYTSRRWLAEPIIWASGKPILRAAAQFVLGAVRTFERARGYTPAFYLGEVSNGGRHGYFPLVYLIKEPIAWWGIVVIALIAAVRLPWKNFFLPRFLRDHTAESFMIVWLALYWVLSVTSDLNIGIRHLLPAYPFMIILAVGLVWRFFKQNDTSGDNFTRIKNIPSPKALAVILTLLMGWYVLESFLTYPFYLSYFNQIAGGSSGGYRYVADSNLDWGQDLPRLAQWVHSNGIRKIDLDYFGWADQAYYLGQSGFTWINADTYANALEFKKINTSDGWIAVSATFLQNSAGNSAGYAWLKSFKPVTVIGSSIFVWRFE